MTVEIQDVLTLLPEMFPGVQNIPLANIRPNPDNPGPALTDQEVQELADNLADRGLVNPLKLRADKANPLAEGVKPHPENLRITAEGRPWALGDFRFMVLAGERRYRAAGRLGWGTIQGFILNPTEEEAVEITHLDNDVRERGWWAGYQSIEQLIQANPNLTQRQVASKLKMAIPKINRAMGLFPLLNPEARVLIVTNCNNSNNGIWGISEAALSRLTDLGPGTGLKPGVKKAGEEVQKLWPYPAISPEAQALVLRTLKVAVDQQMTEAGVKGLVAWVKDGGAPEKYAPVAKTQAASSPEDPQDEDVVERIPWSENSKHPEYLSIPTSRIRVNDMIDSVYGSSINVERKALSMQAIGRAARIMVRSLSLEEKAADPDHDYELFDGLAILKGAERLGWPTLDAQVYAIDEWEGVRLHNALARVTFPMTWVQLYAYIQRTLESDPETTLAELAIVAQEDPAFASKVIPVLKLLNEPVREAINESIHKCYEGLINNGGYRFRRELALPLARMEGASKDLAETQRLVERVVRVAIEHEMWVDAVEELVDWTLAGNRPEEFQLKEA